MMELFDYSEWNNKCAEAIRKLPKEKLDQPLSIEYPAGEKAVEELMTFLPEDEREAAIQYVIGNLLVT